MAVNEELDCADLIAAQQKFEKTRHKFEVATPTSVIGSAD